MKKEGDEFDYGGARFHVLAPGRDQDTGAMRPNDDCLVFTASLGRTAALLEGDRRARCGAAHCGGTS